MLEEVEMLREAAMWGKPDSDRRRMQNLGSSSTQNMDVDIDIETADDILKCWRFGPCLRASGPLFDFPVGVQVHTSRRK